MNSRGNRRAVHHPRGLFREGEYYRNVYNAHNNNATARYYTAPPNRHTTTRYIADVPRGECIGPVHRVVITTDGEHQYTSLEVPNPFIGRFRQKYAYVVAIFFRGIYLEHWTVNAPPPAPPQQPAHTNTRLDCTPPRGDMGDEERDTAQTLDTTTAESGTNQEPEPEQADSGPPH